MRRLYLIRHGHPDFPFGAHMCLGHTDTPLGALGRMQACALGKGLGGRGLTVFSSPLVRCRETAAPLGGETIIVPALIEQDMGPWDGLNFNEIRQRWPELYARRGAEPLLVPPGAETLAQVQARVMPALRTCMKESTGDIAIVAHASVIQALLAAVGSVPLEESRPLRPPYASCTTIIEDGGLLIEQAASLFYPPLTPALALALLLAAGPGDFVVAHCRAVAREALRIADALPFPLDQKLLESAALLHDIARGQKDHARLGADWLGELGYNEAAALIAQHHDWRGETVDEAAVLYLADKCVQEDRRVTIAERFAVSARRCLTPEAKAAHAERLETTLRLRDEINKICGKTLVE